MADHELIAAELDVLSRRLPPPAVAELADGLRETYETHLARLGDPEEAAHAALAEFGDADTVTTAFVRACPWRRIAVTLLLTGPVVGTLWAISLVAGQVWNWPVPSAARIGSGAGMIAIVAILLAAVSTRLAYRMVRIAALAGAAGLVILDAGMLAVVVTIAPVVPWPLALAVPASLARIIATMRALLPALSR